MIKRNYNQGKENLINIRIERTNLVIGKECIEKYEIEMINDERVLGNHDNYFRNCIEISKLLIPIHITKCN